MWLNIINAPFLFTENFQPQLEQNPIKLIVACIWNFTLESRAKSPHKYQFAKLDLEQTKIIDKRLAIGDLLNPGTCMIGLSTA